MKKTILSLILIVGFGVYVFMVQTTETSTPVALVVTPEPKKNTPIAVLNPIEAPSQVSVVVPVPINKPQPAPSIPKPVPTPAPIPTGKFQNGSYTGIVADAYYGNVQVKAIISGGKLTDVQFLDYPQDRSNSKRINSRATPILAQEAISIQDSNVNTVSGASATSAAFRESLSSALSQAKA